MEQSAAMLDKQDAGNNAGSSSLTLTASSRDESDRNPIFDALVSAEGEVSGLVAYSLYKQNKRAWLDDFIKLTGRTPTDAETRAYIIGESTERRLATYRQLAQTTLGQQPGRSATVMPSGISPVAGALWALVVVVALALLGFGLHAFNLLGSK